MKKVYESPVAELIELSAMEDIALLKGRASDDGIGIPDFSAGVSTEPPGDDWS